MPDFGLLGKLALDLHTEFVRIYYLLLPAFFALAVVVQWFKGSGGTVDFIDILRRAVIATLLLVAFPEIAKAIVFVADGIAEQIDKTNSLDAVISMAKTKADTYRWSPKMLLAMFDMFFAIVTFLSYFILFLARYLTIAMYHFYWIFYMITSPLLLLFYMFKGTTGIAVNLFKGMIEVACWKIVWAIFGAMLAALSFGDMYSHELSYLTIVTMNLVIALAMWKTPSMVSSLVGPGIQSTASQIGAAATAAIAGAATLATPMKAAQVLGRYKSVANMGQQYFQNRKKTQDAKRERDTIYKI